MKMKIAHYSITYSSKHYFQYFGVFHSSLFALLDFFLYKIGIILYILPVYVFFVSHILNLFIW